MIRIFYYIFVLIVMLSFFAVCQNFSNDASRQGDISLQEASGHTLEEWKEKLSPLAYKVIWEKGTEKPFSGTLLDNKKKGVYRTAVCKQPVFHSDQKYDSGTGWPSFWRPITEDAVKVVPDYKTGFLRWEVLGSRCGEHLGHVFDDGPAPTGKRYCINSVALDFKEDPDAREEQDVFEEK